MASKCLIVLFGVVAVALANEKYTDKYDNTDIKELMENERLLNGYYNCLLDKGPCTPEGKELKINLGDALETGCSKCTETQEQKSSEMIEFLIEKKKEMWNELCAKFDPTGKWRKTYEERAKAKGINLPTP